MNEGGFDRVHDTRVRAAAFDWLAAQVQVHGDVLQRKILAGGFFLDETRVPLVGPQGIFKPRVLRDVPLSITTVPEGPYDDAFTRENLLRYRYRGTDPQHADNRGLRLALDLRLPLVYFHGVLPGRYVPAWPVFVVGDDPTGLAFSIAVDDVAHASSTLHAAAVFGAVHEDADAGRRQYITVMTRQRLHQRAFRERVLQAYRRQCAFCRLAHEELLDAAHIIADAEAEGEPVVPNGLALCALHHAAFDRHFLGLRPDCVVQVRPDVLREHDGPTLVHALQRLHGLSILLPRAARLRPDPARLEARYESFRLAARAAGE
ncbi:MAG: HNH endonuclease [Planctomycetes bacterium]|nr:HNH endonuclease [Planctomycetota bacterium]